jgi:uncharacterized protein
MRHDHYPDSYIRDILSTTRVIALVGASPKPDRDSFEVMQFLQQRGYRVIPVNPQAAGTVILGEACVSSLAEIAEPVDMVDVFRRSDAVPGIVDEAIAIGAKVIWLQLGVVHANAAGRAEAAGIKVVMDRCPKIEIRRLAA